MTALTGDGFSSHSTDLNALGEEGGCSALWTGVAQRFCQLVSVLLGGVALADLAVTLPRRLYRRVATGAASPEAPVRVRVHCLVRGQPGSARGQRQ